MADGLAPVPVAYVGVASRRYMHQVLAWTGETPALGGKGVTEACPGFGSEISKGYEMDPARMRVTDRSIR